MFKIILVGFTGFIRFSLVFSGFTPLMEAVAQNNKYAIDILLKNSADLELKDHRDRSARNIADEFKCKFFQDKTSNRRTILNNL